MTIASICFNCLGPKQEEVVLHFFSVNDVFVSLPTGSGKFFSHSLLLSVFDKVHQLHSLSFILVVSPLAALMREREVRQKTLSEFPMMRKCATMSRIIGFHSTTSMSKVTRRSFRPYVYSNVWRARLHATHDALGICSKQQWKLPLHHIIILQE